MRNTVYLGRYQINQLQGEGRNADVYRAYDLVRRGEVALKVYKPGSLDHQTAEAATQHWLADSPGVMRLYDVHPDALPREATAMPLADGSLADRVPMAAAEARSHLLRIYTALAFCHGRGVVHGDVKPANCFLDPHGHVLLGDFGVADFLPGGQRGHTLEYAAPEAIAGNPRSLATDVWAASVMLYELLCGDLPFGSTAEHPEALVADHIRRGAFPRVADHAPFLPRALQRFFERAFMVDPARRPTRTATDAHNLLADIPLRADWVRVTARDCLEHWEGVERDAFAQRTGVLYEASLVRRPRAGRYEAYVTRQRPGRRRQSFRGAKPCVDASEKITRQCMYSKMRAITEGRNPG